MSTTNDMIDSDCHLFSLQQVASLATCLVHLFCFVSYVEDARSTVHSVTLEMSEWHVESHCRCTSSTFPSPPPPPPASSFLPPAHPFGPVNVVTSEIDFSLRLDLLIDLPCVPLSQSTLLDCFSHSIIFRSGICSEHE